MTGCIRFSGLGDFAVRLDAKAPVVDQHIKVAGFAGRAIGVGAKDDRMASGPPGARRIKPKTTMLRINKIGMACSVRRSR